MQPCSRSGLNTKNWLDELGSMHTANTQL